MKACFHSEPDRRPSAQEAAECIRLANASSSDAKTDSLLSQIFPTKVAEALRDGRKIEPTAHDCVTVFFSDIVSVLMPYNVILIYRVYKFPLVLQIGYTEIASELPPTKVSDLLDRLYTKFDRLCILHDVFKVETVGSVCSWLVKFCNLTSFFVPLQ